MHLSVRNKRPSLLRRNQNSLINIDIGWSGGPGMVFVSVQKMGVCFARTGQDAINNGTTEHAYTCTNANADA